MSVEEVKRKLVPPDGGWGWVVCLAYALNNIIVLPLISGFGLIFQKTFTEFGISATQSSVILTVNYAFGMVLSLFNGPLLRSFGCRKVAIAGTLFVVVGVLTTAVGRTFTHILISYSLMASIGVAFTMSSFHLAINSYFNKNRGKAMAVAMSITGLGPIFIPQVITLLIDALGNQGAVVVLGALSLHSLVAALLLRPVKWYMKPEENIEEGGAENDKENQEDKSSRSIEMQDMSKSLSHLTENADDYMEDKKNTRISVRSLDKLNPDGPNGHVEKVKSNPDVRGSAESVGNKIIRRWWEASASDINLGSCIDIFEHQSRRQSVQTHGSKRSLNSLLRGVSTSPEGNPLLDKEKNNVIELDKDKEESKKKSIAMKIVYFFDLTLLKDPIFVNIMIGISLAACAEMNFSFLTPFIFKDYQFTTAQIASLMSIIAGCDIAFRFISPFIGDWCRKSARVMYAASLFMLIFTRSSIFFASSYDSMIIVAVGLGVAKGVRAVYVSLVIPNYVPIERLAFATGIQMVVNGIILITIGPVLGYIRDRTGSYNISIVCINIITALTILLWGGEYLYCRAKNKIKT